MTVQEAIDYIDEVKPSAFKSETKTRWLSECEAGSVMRTAGIKAKPLKYPDDAGRELSAPPPYDKLYVEYLEAAIDYRNQDYAKYQNSHAVYNATENEYAKWWERNKYEIG